MEKKFVSIKNIDDCEKFLLNLEDCPYILNISTQNDNYEIIKYLVKHSQKIEKNIEIINLNLPYEMIPKKDFETICDFASMFSNARCNILVEHRYIEDDRFIDKTGIVMWDLQTIIKANKSIYKVCDFIEKSKFSPFEAFAFIHQYVSTIAKYNSSTVGGTWLSHDQFFPGAFFDLPEVICMGYSSLEKEIIDTLNMTGLKCDIVAMSFYNKDKQSTDKHARCIIRVLDEKYGINQSCYDDPTWDNSEDICKYAHFAMNKDCHDRKTNDKYQYNYPDLIDLSPKQTKTVKDLTSRWEYNKSENPISQLQIEKAYFNVLLKTNPNLNFNESYDLLSKMAEQSYKEQTFRRFKGNLTQENLLLSKDMARAISSKNKQAHHDLSL